MLNSLFPEMFGNGSNGGTNLSSGGAPTHLEGNDRSVLANYASVPSRVSQSDVDRIAREAGNIEAHTAIMREWSSQALAAQTAALANLDVRITHASSSMKNEEAYRKRISKHGKNVLEHKLINSATKANIDGYQQALSNANETISL